MDNSFANKSIKCSVQQCKYHNNHEDYCSLDCIKVGTHEENPTVNQCTDCESFEETNERTRKGPGLFACAFYIFTLKGASPYYMLSEIN